jgi:demethoxyubiquinone hydroxylase (CLK1/Coq7/Cat5 family)
MSGSRKEFIVLSQYLDPMCFFASGKIEKGEAHYDQSTLKSAHAEALAKLIPLLGCGEEAATLAFDSLSRATTDAMARYALHAIALEEREHDMLLRNLAQTLPCVLLPADTRRAVRKFHLGLRRGGYTLHLARIAAIDAAVCTILSRLLRKGGPLAADKSAHATLKRIHSDEARHVRVARRLASFDTDRHTLCTVAVAAREALADIVGGGADAFEVLGVDPKRLIQDIVQLPNGMFVA